LEFDKAGFSETAMGSDAIGRRATDDNMIKNFDAKDLAGLNELACDSDILGAWRWIAGRVIVRKNDGGGIVQKSPAKDFTGMNKGRIENAQRDKAAVYDIVFRIEIENDESFLCALRHVGTLGGDALGRSDRNGAAVGIRLGFPHHGEFDSERPGVRRLCPAGMPAFGWKTSLDGGWFLSLEE